MELENRLMEKEFTSEHDKKDAADEIFDCTVDGRNAKDTEETCGDVRNWPLYLLLASPYIDSYH